MQHKIALLAGRMDALGPDGVISAIAKRPVSAPVSIGTEGMSGDEQADRRFHGGPEKALHFYPHDHYSVWRSELGETPVLQAPGAFGENMSGAGLSEKDVAVGDVFRLGTSRIQVSQGRQPCFKLNIRFGVPDMALRLQRTGRTGWYFRVLEEGTAQPQDEMELLERPAPDWTIARLLNVFFRDALNRDELEALARLEVLAEGWRRHAARRLESGRVEDWSRRLHGSKGRTGN